MSPDADQPDDRHPQLGPDDQDYIVERDARLSESLLWRLQRDFHEAQDARLWGSGRVPSYVTTNAWVARAYARLLVATLLDLGRQDPDRLVTILEVGGGSGRLACLILRELDALVPLCADALPPFRYVLSDISETSLEAWEHHPAFAAWLASGRMDLARFDLEDAAPRLHLRRAGVQVDAANPCGPLLVIASYVLDGLVQDAFRVRDGKLDEGRVNLVADHPFADSSDPGILDGLAAMFGWRPLQPAPYYDDPALDAVLDSYREHLVDGAFAFPLGALRALGSLAAMSRGGLFLLSTDKAWRDSSQLEGQTAPYVMGHGSLSMMVDHHAIARFVEGRGGSSLVTTARPGAVETALFILDATASLHLTRLAFDAELEAASPADFLERTLALEAEPQPDLERVVALLRLGAWDPDWLWALLPAIESNGPDASAPLLEALRDAIGQVERRVFAIPGERHDVSALLARAWAAAGRPDPAAPTVT